MALAGYWETPFDQLPDAVKPFALEIEPMGWDGRSPQQRQSVATQLDWQHDPRYEPSLYWELTAYQSELEQQESLARGQSNHGVALALVDVQKRIDRILGTDRSRVGAEIKSLRKMQSVTSLKPVQALPAELDKEKQLGTSERKTLLTIIAAMAVKGLKLNVHAPGKAAVYISGLTDELGTHVSKRAIEDHLKKIPDALETRMK